MNCYDDVDVVATSSPAESRPVVFVYQLPPLRQGRGFIGHCGHAVRNVSPVIHWEGSFDEASSRRKKTEEARRYLSNTTLV